MKTGFTYALFFITLLFFSSTFAQVQSINGWNMEEKNGSYLFKPEKVPGDTREFFYELMPMSRATGVTFEDWFNYVIDKDLQQAGYTLPASANKKSITTNRKIFSFSSEVKDKTGKTWFATYVSYQTPDSEYRLARAISSPDLKFYAANMRPVASHFNWLAKQVTQPGTYYAIPEKVIEEDNYLALNGHAASMALKPDEIKGMLIQLGTTTTAEGKEMRIYSPYLVLNDGTIYSEPILSPYNFNYALSRVKEPWKWGSWKIKGETFSVDWPSRNESERWTKNWFWATPTSNGERIEGSYTTRSGKDNECLQPGATPGSLKQLTLNSSGQFTIAAVEGAPGASDFSRKNESGTYKLNEYSIELHYNNGHIVRRAFYFYLQGKTNFGVGPAVYMPKR